MRSIFVIGVWLVAAAAHAQIGHDIALKYAHREDGKLEAFNAMRAEGRTFINGEVIPFTMIAQRPNRLRVETFSAARRVIQGYDGSGAPWTTQSETLDGAGWDMSPSEAKDFVANADFDGPLMDFAAKGYSVDYAGEEPVDGKKAFKLLLMNKTDDISFLWVDEETYEVVKRLVYRTSGSKRVAESTVFRDFREVEGVLQPFRVETSVNGRTLYVTLIDKIEANPANISADSFARPVAEANQP